jgi:tight adherence protein B
MDPMAAIAVVSALVAVMLAAALLMRLPVSGKAASPVALRRQMRTIVDMQRAEAGDVSEQHGPSVADTALEQVAIEKVSDTQLTIRKRLKYAQLSQIPPYAFSLAQIAVSLMAFLLMRMYFDSVLQVVALLSGPLFLNWLLNCRIEKRFARFDADFPQFLLSFVGMLKTGLNVTQALQAAASGLEDGSLVKHEVDVMLERLRMGVSEERSIGSFGEDIYHPEIELFVQALLLSRRVGGNLSDTLDRLARQVRRRQHFRQSAKAAVGLQRGSIWFILAVLAALEVYMYFTWPQCVLITWSHPTGRKVAQGGVVAILLGIFWVRQVTKLKV